MIDPNKAGKTACIEAINHAAGWKSNDPQEDDFYVAATQNFNPKAEAPIANSIRMLPIGKNEM